MTGLRASCRHTRLLKVEGMLPPATRAAAACRQRDVADDDYDDCRDAMFSAILSAALYATPPRHCRFSTFAARRHIDCSSTAMAAYAASFAPLAAARQRIRGASQARGLRLR